MERYRWLYVLRWFCFNTFRGQKNPPNFSDGFLFISIYAKYTL